MAASAEEVAKTLPCNLTVGAQKRAEAANGAQHMRADCAPFAQKCDTWAKATFTVLTLAM